MTVSPEERKAIGDAWGRLAGVVVDACKSHHECHCADHAPTVLARRQGEPTTINVDKAACKPSAGPGKNATTVMLPAPTANTDLAVGDMCLLAAGAPMATTPVAATPNPDHLAASHGSRIAVAVDATTPPGLYVGHVDSVTGGPPHVPVLIFIDGLE